MTKTLNSTGTEIAKVEREIVKHAMQRLKSWKKEYPKGLIPLGKPGAMQSKSGHQMIAACLRLEKLRGR